MIVEKLVPDPRASNCYIVGDEASKEGIIIDPGAGAGQILKRVEDLGLRTKLVVLTHGHGDHTGALAEVKEATGAEVAIHSDDARSLQMRRSQVGMPGQTQPDPDRLLQDGDSLNIGDLSVSVIHTPGHTLGGVCLLVEGVLFSGDTLFNFGIGRSDLPGGDGRQLMESIYCKLMVLPDDTVVHPGHGGGTTIGTERRGNPFLNM